MPTPRRPLFQHHAPLSDPNTSPTQLQPVNSLSPIIVQKRRKLTATSIRHKPIPDITIPRRPLDIVPRVGPNTPRVIISRKRPVDILTGGVACYLEAIACTDFALALSGAGVDVAAQGLKLVGALVELAAVGSGDNGACEGGGTGEGVGMGENEGGEEEEGGGLHRAG